MDEALETAGESVGAATPQTAQPDNGQGGEPAYVLPEEWAGKLWQKDGALGEDAPDAVRAEVSRLLRDDAEQFRAIARQCELTQTQAAKLFDLYGAVVGKHVAEARSNASSGASSDASANVPSVDEVIATTWPADTAKNLDIARRGARAAGVGSALDEAGLSANPLVLRLAHALGEALGEDSVVQPGAAGARLPTGAEAREELYRVIGSDAYRNGDKSAVRMAENLSERVHCK